MLQYPATFLIVALITGFTGFTGFGSLGGLVAGIAQILFFVSLLVFFLSFVLNGRTPRK